MTLRLSAVLLSTLVLGACASMIDTAYQDITLKTPGTDQAYCLMDNKVNAYRVHSNQTVRVQRNDEDIRLTCYAPGNKSVSTVIDRDLNAWSIANITNGVVPGVTYDHFSGALYDYPKVITVDFASAASGFPPPDYQTTMGMRPSEHGIENYDAAEPKKNGEQSRSSTLPRKMDMPEIRARSNPLADAPDAAVDIYRP